MNNDLISREALKKAYFNAINETSIGEVSIIDLIDNAPTVKVFTEEYVACAYNEGYMCGSREAEKARPQGEWKVYGKQGGIPITDMCSNCRYEMMWYKNKYKFCPNCGADMQKGGAI